MKSFEELNNILKESPEEFLEYSKRELVTFSKDKLTDLNPRLLAFNAGVYASEASSQSNAETYTKISFLLSELNENESLLKILNDTALAVLVRYVKTYPTSEYSLECLALIDDDINSRLLQCEDFMEDIAFYNKLIRPISEIKSLRNLKNGLTLVSSLLNKGLLKNNSYLCELWNKKEILP